MFESIRYESVISVSSQVNMNGLKLRCSLFKLGPIVLNKLMIAGSLIEGVQSSSHRFLFGMGDMCIDVMYREKVGFGGLLIFCTVV